MLLNFINLLYNGVETAAITYSWEAVTDMWSKSASLSSGASSEASDGLSGTLLKKALKESSSTCGTDTLVPSGTSAGDDKENSSKVVTFK